MFKPRVSTQSEYEFVSIDELVPDNHLLRLIDKYYPNAHSGLAPPS
jgi:hypothetical protein